MQRVTFSVLFYVKRSKPFRNGDLPIYLRITIDGKKAETSLKRGVLPELWDNVRHRAKGQTKEAKQINQELDSVSGQLHNHKLEFQEHGKTVTAQALLDVYLGKGDRQITLTELFEEHNSDMSARVGKDYAPLTLQRYKAGFAHVQTYLERNYNGVEHLINEVNHQFITGFEQYLKVIAGCQHNSAMKHVKALKKIIGIALARDIIRKNPFANYRITIKPTDRGYLMDHELKLLEEQEFTIERLQVIRDLFLFQCYTGLAYKDLEALTPDHIAIGQDGVNWIFIERGKTGVLCKIPILTVPQRILDSYSNHPICTKRGKVLPVPSNQKMNAYLKEIATICGINKDLTTHLARHTFATTIALANDMPMETLSKLLGHRKITTTQIYGRILDKKIGSDMDNLRRKLDNR